MKPETRVIGIDDGPFRFGQAETSLAAVMTRAPSYVEAVLCGQLSVDGRDATTCIERLLAGTGFLQTARALFVDGGALAGFNVVDLAALNGSLGVPVASIVRDAPDGPAVRAALEKHFDDADERWALLTAQPLEPIELSEGTVHVRRVGIPLDDLGALVRSHTVRGRTPEPLRVAHLVATALAEGRSRGA